MRELVLLRHAHAEPAAAGYVSDVVRQLRGRLAASGLGDLPVIYGGSAKPGLLPMLEGVSGLFLGRFAHNPANFGAVLDEALLLAKDIAVALDMSGRRREHWA